MKTILLVEDDAIIAMTIEIALGDAGYDVLGPAATARHAVEIAEQQRPDLALVNINLRDGPVAGVWLVRTLLERWGVSSLFISGNSDIARANDDVALGYIRKPYSPGTVIDSIRTVADVLERHRPPAPVPPGLELFEAAKAASEGSPGDKSG